MASEEVPAISAALTGDGDASGYVTVASNTGYYPGAEAWLSNSTPIRQRVIITDLNGATKIGVRFVADVVSNSSALMYGSRSSAVAFTVATASRIDMPAQLVRVIQPTFTGRSNA